MCDDLVQCYRLVVPVHTADIIDLILATHSIQLLSKVNLKVCFIREVRMRMKMDRIVAMTDVHWNEVMRYSNTVYEQYVQNIMEIEKGLVELRLQLDVANGKDKKILKAKIKEAEESVEAMKIARKSMLKFQSAFETGLAVE